MLRQILGRAILALLGLVLGLLLAETVFRRIYINIESAVFFRQGSEQFGWFHIPNKKGWFGLEGEEFRSLVHINSKGLRDREFPYEKPPRVFRILVLGDSFVEGFQVGQTQTFPKVLERLLNQRSKAVRYEVINAGIGGWGTDNELLFYRHEGYKYQADLVLLGFLAGNDVANNSYVLEKALYQRVLKPYFVLDGDQLQLRNFPYRGEMNVAAPPPPRPAPRSRGEAVSQWLQDRSRLYQFWLFTREQSTSGKVVSDRPAPEVIPNTIPVKYDLYRLQYDEIWQEAWHVTQALIRELDHEVTDHGGRLVVVSLPPRLQVHEDLWQQELTTYPSMQGVEWDLDKPDTILAEFAERMGIPHLALAAGLQAHAQSVPGYLYFVRDGHWNAQGHELAARLIADFLLGQQLVPATR